MGHKELNFTLGGNFGQLIHSVLYEKITVDMSPRKAYDLLDSCGLPATLFNEVIAAKKIIVADEGGQNFYLRDRSELTEEQLKDYRPNDGYSEWLSNKLDKTIEYMDDLVHEIRKMYSGAEHISVEMSQDDFETLFPESKLPDGVTFSGSIRLSPRRIIEAYYNDEKRLLEMVENNGRDIMARRMSVMINDVKLLTEAYEKSEKLIKVAQWLIEQYSYRECKKKLIELSKIADTVGKILYYTKQLDKDKMDELLKIMDPVATGCLISSESHAQMKDELDQYLESQRKADSYVLKPVNISDNWDAGFIAPDGAVYAMNGPTSLFIHLRLAEKIAEEYGIPEKKDEPIDWTLARLGWVRFHHGKILWDAPLADMMGQASSRLTDAQKGRIVRYGMDCCNGHLALGLHGRMVTCEEFDMMDDDELADAFSV